MLCLVVKGSFEEGRRTIRESGRGAELIEFRIDLMERADPLHVGRLLEECDLPVIFTLRNAIQLELLKLKPAYVDLEYDATFRDKIPSDIEVIASYHNFEETPEDLSALYREMQKVEADIYKIACKANSSLDSLRMLAFTKEHERVAGMCMGEYGAITRILAPLVESAITYASEEEMTLSELIDIYHFDRLNSQSKIYALIGDPVDRSFGHLTHNALFRELSENAVYVKFPLTSEELPTLFSIIGKLPFEGFSVTMPLKEEVASYLDEVDPRAREMGAINTLVRRGGRWCGYNTDGDGALDAIEKRGELAGKTLLILGAGGTAKALAYAGRERGAYSIIANRTKSRAESLAARVGGRGVGMDELSSLTYDVLINATSLGMAPNSEAIPIDPDLILKNATVFDAVFNPRETPLLKIAKRKGCRVIYGDEMFAIQAAKQFELWLGRSIEGSSFI